MGNKLRREGDEVRIKVIWPDPLVQADAEWEVIYATGDYGTKLGLDGLGGVLRWGFN